MSETRIDINDLPKRFPELLENAASGNEIVVTQGNVPRAKLVVIEQPRHRVAGLHPGTIQTSDDFDAPLPENFWAGQ
jgi:antitoxin (DNA-binding transcriptional repressor) of toxin-antitoxin stability system